MKIALHVAKGCTPTAKTLTALLIENGLEVGHQKADGAVCWGAGVGGKNTLNSNCSRYDKLQQLEVLNKAGVVVVPFGTVPPPFKSPRYPVLARKLHHHGGKDILICRSPKRCRIAAGRGRTFFTQLIPSSTEFRVWVYRNRHLGTYEKVLKYPAKRKRMVGRNYRNGYAFELCTEGKIPRSAVEMAILSVSALGLDFGAVDVLLGRDGKYYVLEVNTAPGVEGEGRQVIQSLATRIAKWAEKGFPAKQSV